MTRRATIEVTPELAAFCEAHFGCPPANVVRAAVAEFIANECRRNPWLERRYRDALEAGKAGGNVVVLRPRG